MKKTFIAIFSLVSLSFYPILNAAAVSNLAIEVKLLHSQSEVPVQQGNVRVKLRVESMAGALVKEKLTVTNHFGTALGQLQLEPGSYRVTAISMGTGTSGKSTPTTLKVSHGQANGATLPIYLN